MVPHKVFLGYHLCLEHKSIFHRPSLVPSSGNVIMVSLYTFKDPQGPHRHHFAWPIPSAIQTVLDIGVQHLKNTFQQNGYSTSEIQYLCSKQKVVAIKCRKIVYRQIHLKLLSTSFGTYIARYLQKCEGRRLYLMS